MRVEADLAMARRIVQAFAGGEMDEAGRLLATWSSRAIRDAKVHCRLGEVAEGLGEVERAILEYNYALREDPNQVDIIRRIARLRVELGDVVRAVRAWRRVLQLSPEDVEAYAELGQLFEQEGQFEQAVALYERAAEHTGEPSFAEAARRVRVASRTRWGASANFGEESPGDREAAAAAAVDPAIIAPTDADCVAFAHLFTGREGVYAKQWASPTGKHGYTPVREPFTPQVARQHLLGALTVGVYPVRMDNTVGFVAIDIDIARFRTPAGPVAARRAAQLLRVTQQVARQFVDAAAAMDLPVYVEDSGWKGRHVWLFFDAPVPAAAARRLGQAWINHAGPLPPDVRIELFPKQSRVRRDKLGNLIKLPLGVHRVSGRRALFVDVDGKPLEDQLGLIHTVERLDRRALRRILEVFEGDGAPGSEDVLVAEVVTGVEAGAGSSSARREARPRAAPGPGDGFDDPFSGPAVEVQPEVEPRYDIENDEEVQWLLSKCAVLGRLVQKALSDGVLTSDEQKVVAYTMGHLARGPQAVNYVFERTLNVPPQQRLKSRLRGNPMSCARVRQRASDVAMAVGCNCRFAAGLGAYPTPLLHLASLRARGAAGVPSTALTRVQVEYLAADLYSALQDLARVRTTVERLERRILGFLDAQGVTELHTRTGVLRRDPSRPGGVMFVMRSAGMGGESGSPSAQWPGRGGAGRGAIALPPPASSPGSEDRTRR